MRRYILRFLKHSDFDRWTVQSYREGIWCITIVRFGGFIGSNVTEHSHFNLGFSHQTIIIKLKKNKQIRYWIHCCHICVQHGNALRKMLIKSMPYFERILSSSKLPHTPIPSEFGSCPSICAKYRLFKEINGKSSFIITLTYQMDRCGCCDLHHTKSWFRMHQRRSMHSEIDEYRNFRYEVSFVTIAFAKEQIWWIPLRCQYCIITFNEISNLRLIGDVSTFIESSTIFNCTDDH